jgi:chemotaxis protein methyltransferase CheR
MMHEGLPERLLSQLSERVAQQMGLHFPRERLSELEAGVRSAARELGIADVSAWARTLLSSPLTKTDIEVLASELTIGETYFLREKRSLAAFVEHILPELIRARRDTGRRLRIWSAGCCTGEEAYSIAILLERAIPDLSDWRVNILATDINPRFLRKAAEGVYGEWSFRDAPPWLKQSYFTPAEPRRLAILPRIRKYITFSYLNLAEDAFPSLANNTNAIDVIFCRNVLMYFSPQRAQTIVEKLRRSLVEGGWLIVSAVETSASIFSEFTSVSFDGAVLYRNGAQPTSAAKVACNYVTAPSSAFAEPSVTSLPEFTSAAQVAQTAAATLATSGRTLQQAQPGVAVYEEALALYKQGEYSQAARSLQQKSAVAVQHVECCRLAARVHANLGELTQARWWADHAIAAEKVNAPSHYLRALILQEEGSIDEAVASLQRALYLAPDLLLAHFALGNIERQRGRHKQALRHLGNARALLAVHADEDELPHADGLVAGRLKEMIETILLAEGAS